MDARRISIRSMKAQEAADEKIALILARLDERAEADARVEARLDEILGQLKADAPKSAKGR